jgi:hypothetical protein
VNVSSLYRAGSLKTVSRELARYKLDLVGVQEVKWEGSGTEPVGEYTFFYGKGNENHELGTGFFVHQRIMENRVLRRILCCSCSIQVVEEHRLRVFENRVLRRILTEGV